jgi:hypothetical protein
MNVLGYRVTVREFAGGYRWEALDGHRIAHEGSFRRGANDRRKPEQMAREAATQAIRASW